MYGETIEKCFSKNYNFGECGDPYKFLLNQGIDIDKDIIHLSKLKRIKKKSTGHSKGGIYRDSHKNIYYVKKCRIFNEIVGSRLMNLIVGTETTPIVKPIKNHKNRVASTKIKSFKMEKSTYTHSKTILNEVLLRIAMDYLGLVDRHPRNMGFVRQNSKTLLAGRVDYDTCFDFESRKSYTSKTNHLSLKHLHRSIKKCPKDEIISALRKIIEIPNEQILMSIFQSWVLLSRSGTKTSYTQCFELAQKLLERKEVFRDALENPNSYTYNLLMNKKEKSPKKEELPEDILGKAFFRL